jgi:hypothetical protein
VAWYEEGSVSLKGGDSICRPLCFVVDGYHSVLDAYDAGIEAIWIRHGFRRRRARASPAT